MKLGDLSLRQAAIGIFLLGLIDWALLQFIDLPRMTEQQRKNFYPGFLSTPYPYLVSGIFVCAALWFVFVYRGPLMTQGRKVAAFGMALGAICGMLLILIIRITWHI